MANTEVRPAGNGVASAGQFFLHVFALSGLALAQPVYSWMASQPEFLVAHGATPLKGLFVVGALSLVLPLVLFLAVLIFRLFGRRALLAVQLLLVALLGGVFGLHAVPWEGGWLVIMGFFALVCGLLYWRLLFFRQVLVMLVAVAVVLPGVFMASQPVRGILWSPEAHARVLDGVDLSQDGEVAPPELILFVMLDELPAAFLVNEAGEIDARQFPAFARLAQSATWYPRAATIHRGTRHAVPSALNGRFPPPDGPLPRWNNYRQTLFTWSVSLYGESIYGYEWFTRLCPEVICSGRIPDPGMEMLALDLAVLLGHAVTPPNLALRHLPSLHDRTHGFVQAPGFWAPGVHALTSDRTLQWRRFMRGGFEGFVFKHLYLPHAPLVYLYDGVKYPDLLEQAGYTRRDNVPGFYPMSIQRRHAQLRYADKLLSGLMDHLEHTGIWDDTLLVVTADHGHSHRPDVHHRTLEEMNIGDIVNIPLFIKQPGQQQGYVDDYPASLIDLAPTIAEIVGKPLNWEYDGVSLVSPDRPERLDVPVSCIDIQGCNRSYQRQADDRVLIHFDMDEYDLHLRRSRDWHNNHYRFDSQLEMLLPDIPESGLLRRAVDELDVRAPLQSAVEVLGRHHYDQVELAAGELPVLLGGEVREGALESGEWLVVALNGVIAGTGIVADVEDQDQQVFGAQLWPGAFVEGSNELGVYRVLWSGQQVEALKPLQIR